MLRYRKKNRSSANVIFVLPGVFFLSILITPSLSSGQVFVTSYTQRYNGVVGQYSPSGVYQNPSLVSGLQDPYGIAVGGSEVYVVDYATTNGTTSGQIERFNTSTGAYDGVVASGLSQPIGIAFSGGNLFVQEENTIAEYSAAGSIVSANLINFGGISYSVAVFGSDVFVPQYDNGSETGWVAEYTTSGAVVNPYLVNYLPSVPYAVAATNSYLFVGNGNGTVGEYTISGQVVDAAMISGLGQIRGLAVEDADLFVLSTVGNGIDIVSEYATSGQLVNPSVAVVSGESYGLAVTVPEPSSIGVILIATVAVFRRKRGAGPSY